jgi:hypothetical protein
MKAIVELAAMEIAARLSDIQKYGEENESG